MFDAATEKKRSGGPVEVTAALIRNGDTFMICQRPEGKKRALLWEFPGGKLEAGETLEQCLIRECQEELGITLSVGDVFLGVNYVYPDIAIHLTVFNAAIAHGEVQMREHRDIRWITADETDGYAFCPADTAIIARLKTHVCG